MTHDGDPRPAPPERAPSRNLWRNVAVGVAIAVVLLVAAVAFFPWDVLRGPLNRYVSQQTGRHFEITRRLDVKVGRTTRVIADGIEFANPEWAHDPLLLQAEGAEIDIELLPLLRSRIELPRVELRRPRLALQVEGDGRRSWALGHDTADPHNFPQIGAFVVDQGTMHFMARDHGADIHTDFEIDAAPAEADRALPLKFSARGTWEKEAFTAQGRTGNVLYLSAPLQHPFPVRLQAEAGHTRLSADGSISSLETLAGANAQVRLQGPDLADLYKFIGVVLPATPRFSLQASVTKEGETWQARRINGKLGQSDLSGDLAFDRSGAVPVLTGKLRSHSLDFADLAPLVGLPEQPTSAAALPHVPGKDDAATRESTVARARDRDHKVLPSIQLDLARMQRMDADVQYEADHVTHAKDLPIDRLQLHVALKDGSLKLDPLRAGFAGGNLQGRLSIDGRTDPALADVHLDGNALELNKLFPRVALMHASFGKIHARIDLKGRGNSVARMLGTSDGNVAILMGNGQISNLLLEIAGLDGGEIIKFLLKGDRNVELRCGGAAFDVKQGLMTSRALVLDTTDTIIYGDGRVNLADEALDLTLRPYPKDMSILALRSPLRLAGTFAQPKPGPDKGALAGRAGVVLVLAAINPLLGLAATVETGPGKGQEAECGPALREAWSPYAAARIAAMSQPAVEEKRRKLMGAAPTPGPDTTPPNTK